jgi:hypothetical protein
VRVCRTPPQPPSKTNTYRSPDILPPPHPRRARRPRRGRHPGRREGLRIREHRLLVGEHGGRGRERIEGCDHHVYGWGGERALEGGLGSVEGEGEGGQGGEGEGNGTGGIGVEVEGRKRAVFL